MRICRIVSPGPADHAGIRVRIVGDHLAVREVQPPPNEVVRLVTRHVHAIVRHAMQRRVVGCLRMPVELHREAAGPLNDRVLADRIVKRIDQYVGAGRTRRFHRLIDVRHEIAGALVAERIGNRRFETEHREHADGRLNVLRRGLAGRRRHREYRARGRLAAERREEAVDERVEIGGRDIHVRGVVLRTHRDARPLGRKRLRAVGRFVRSGIGKRGRNRGNGRKGRKGRQPDQNRSSEDADGAESNWRLEHFITR